MRTKTYLLIILALFGFNVLYCLAISDKDSVNTILSGKWNWVFCSGGISGTCFDQPDTNNQRSVIFSGDDQDGITYSVYRNDTLISAGILMLKYDSVFDTWWTNSDVVFGFDSVLCDYYEIIFYDSINIGFSECCMDGFIYDYQKDTSKYKPVDIPGEQYDKNIEIFPNPADDIINIEIENYNNTTIEIYSFSGKLIYSKEVSERIETIDISGYAKGIYLVKVMQANNVYIRKIAIM